MSVMNKENKLEGEIILWTNGYGFIESPELDDNIFFHISNLDKKYKM